MAASTVSTLARPVLEDLVARFKETAFVGKLLGTEVQSVAMVVPDSESQTYVQPGRVMPVHAAASAKAIWAFQDDRLVDEVLVQPRDKFTDKTRIGEAEVRGDLDRVRREFGAAGRGRRRIAAGRPNDHERAWLVASLRQHQPAERRRIADPRGDR